MRFFRIPSFTGIEAHRDDADRGSLRVSEGCLPSGPGGLRSGPVWSEIGTVSSYSSSPLNQLSAADDGKGNSVMFASRAKEVHDVKVFPTANTNMAALGATYDVQAAGSLSVFNTREAYLTDIGNRAVGWGDGTTAAMWAGKGPPLTADQMDPAGVMYSQEFSWFPKCRFFVVGPNKTIFAAGNVDSKLTVYITEPAGLTVPERIAPYSTELSKVGTTSGSLSTVDLLMTGASEITALTNRGNQVVVHTDAGAYILYAPGPDNAEDGYRVAQAPSNVTSAAVNQNVAGGEDGTQPYYLGFDGQIYKDEAPSRGSEDTDRYSDPDQASWKAQGRWDDEHPESLAKAFATYDPETGLYWVYLESDEYTQWRDTQPPDAPSYFSAEEEDLTPANPLDFRGVFDADSVAPLNPTAFAGVFDIDSTVPANPSVFTGVFDINSTVPGAPSDFEGDHIATDICLVTTAGPLFTLTFAGANDGKAVWENTVSSLSIWWSTANSRWEFGDPVGGTASAHETSGATYPYSAGNAWDTLIDTVADSDCASAIPPNPTNLGGVFDIHSVVPGNPTSLGGIFVPVAPSNPTDFTGVQLLPPVPSNPTNFAGIAQPGAPTGFGGVFDIHSVVPSNPSAFGGTVFCDSNDPAPCNIASANYQSSYSVLLRWSLSGVPDSTGTISLHAAPNDPDEGHGEYRGTVQVGSSMNQEIRLQPPGWTGTTDLELSFAQGGNVVFKTLEKQWTDICENARCLPLGTYTLTEFGITYTVFVT